MKKIILTSTTLISIFAITSCGTRMLQGTLLLNEVKDVGTFDTKLIEDINYLKLVDAENKFSGKISEAIFNGTDKNFAISPASIYLCLVLLSAIASGEAKQEVIDALNIDFNSLDAYYKDFFSSINYSKDDCDIFFTNSAWIDSTYKLTDEISKTLGEKYLTYLYETSFSSNLENAKKSFKYIYKRKNKRSNRYRFAS